MLAKSKIPRVLMVLIILISFQVSLFAQEFIEDLPDDLPTSKVLFIKYQATKQPPSKPKDAEGKRVYNLVALHNKKVPSSNKDLETALRKYPYEYKMCNRSEIEKWGKQGYKYVLDSDMFTLMSNGFRQDKSKTVAGTKHVTTYLYKLYLEEIGTDNKYLVTDEFKENYMYFPKWIINNVYMKEVKKKFK